MASQRYEAHVIPATGTALVIGLMHRVLETVVPLLSEHPSYEVRIRRRKDPGDNTPHRGSVLLRRSGEFWVTEVRDNPNAAPDDPEKIVDQRRIREGLSSYGIADEVVVTSEVTAD